MYIHMYSTYDRKYMTITLYHTCTLGHIKGAGSVGAGFSISNIHMYSTYVRIPLSKLGGNGTRIG